MSPISKGDFEGVVERNPKMNTLGFCKYSQLRSSCTLCCWVQEEEEEEENSGRNEWFLWNEEKEGRGFGEIHEALKLSFCSCFCESVETAYNRKSV